MPSRFRWFQLFKKMFRSDLELSPNSLLDPPKVGPIDCPPFVRPSVRSISKKVIGGGAGGLLAISFFQYLVNLHDFYKFTFSEG